MSDITDREFALTELQRLSQYQSEPELSADDLEEILDANKRGSRWTTVTALTLGTVIIPTVRNGHVYKVTDEGTTGATEPSWDDFEGAIVSNGSVEFTESGRDFANIYNITGAVRDAWALKAAKASELHEGDEAKIFDHCAEQAERSAVPLIA